MGCRQSKSSIDQHANTGNSNSKNETPPEKAALPTKDNNMMSNQPQPTSTNDDDDDDDVIEEMMNGGKMTHTKPSLRKLPKSKKALKSTTTTATSTGMNAASTAHMTSSIPIRTTTTSTAAATTTNSTTGTSAAAALANTGVSASTTTITDKKSKSGHNDNNSSSNSTMRSSDRVYKLLLKAIQHRNSTTTGNIHRSKAGGRYHPNQTNTTSTASSSNNHPNTTSTTCTTSLDERAVLQAMSPSAASYRNPETHFSPLHLAVQLIDSHSIALLPSQQQDPPASSSRHITETRPPLAIQGSSSSLLQVIAELIKAYPDAVHTPDVYGYIPLHYAIAPLYTNSGTIGTCSTTEATATIRMSTYSLQQQQSIPPTSTTPNSKSKKGKSPLKSPAKNQDRPTLEETERFPASIWPLRTSIVRLLLQSDTTNASFQYLSRNDITYHPSSLLHPIHHNSYKLSSLTGGNISSSKNRDTNGGCTPLYRILQMIPDDSTVQQAPTLEYVHTILKYMVQKQNRLQQQQQSSSFGTGTPIVSMGNREDGDKPLALLYRRFTRQFDVSEQFFTGDNSRKEVVEHRHKYKMAASNTWKMIELLIQQQPQVVVATTANTSSSSSSHLLKKTTYRIVHRAVQGETPPDLLRYIVETNAEELTIRDEMGNVPLHYAARYRPKQISSDQTDKKSSFPAFYSKYVMDELLYKYPEAATLPDRDGKYPLILAVQSGKQWIGGGIKSLFDAYPEAVSQIDVSLYPSLQRALTTTSWHQGSDEGDDDDDENVGVEQNEQCEEEKKTSSPQQQLSQQKQIPFDIIRDEPHDAIMLVQDENVDISEVVTSMWAHEEDAGVQMLGCMAIRRLLHGNDTNVNAMDHCLRIALSAVPAVVNAMKAHPNEVIVQEKACHTLRAMASADGQREVSFVASGAVAAIVGAMQAHVSDPTVQEEACGALSQILYYGGPDRATVVASVSGLTAMINAMAAHPKVGTVQREGCRALLELTNYSATANLPELPKSQTENLLEHAQQMFPEECTEMVQILLLRLT
jgi:hypothetical protein